MIDVLDHRDPEIAMRIYDLQQTSYAVERELIGVEEFYPLTVAAEQIGREPGTFLGWWDGNGLTGVVSFAPAAEEIDIGRMVVHPAHFRRGIVRRVGAPVSARDHANPGEANEPFERDDSLGGAGPAFQADQ